MKSLHVKVAVLYRKTKKWQKTDLKYDKENDLKHHVVLY